MTNLDLRIIPTDLLESYKLAISEDSLYSVFNRLEDAELSSNDFSFYMAAGAVYSCKIEGEQIELDSFVKFKRFHIELYAEYVQQADDLYVAYEFAAKNMPFNDTIANAHRLFAKHIVSVNRLGEMRDHISYVTSDNGHIEYVACLPGLLASEMEKFLGDIGILLKSQLTFCESLYFASMIHLVFVKLHPWTDGNGRCARLLEKWFLANKIGQKAWYIQSEKYYHTHHEWYYKNISTIGTEYSLLDYSRSLPFLLMLPGAIMDVNG